MASVMQCGARWMGPAIGLLMLGLAGCSGDDGKACLDPLPRDCAYVWGDYEAIHDNLLGSTCGGSSTGGSCHAPEGAQGGLVLQDADGAYDALLGGDGGEARVIPGDPECSELVRRIYSSKPGTQMPPGQPLSDEQKCSIVRWIADGADRQ